MSREDIQAFLDNYNSFLTGYRSPDINNASRTASDIIYRAASEHKINPKYLLVKLQKEQSLITDKSPTQKQLDWATGYGICDDCSMSDPALQKHKGFGVQVDSAAAVIRWYYENLSAENWIKRTGQTYLIDGVSVRPSTLATAFLYTYTPHIHGNQNFWTLWQKWFEQVYPNGSLVKSSDSPAIYLLQDGTKRPFANMSALITRFDPKFIINLPSSELKNYPTGAPISLPNYSILKSGGNYYLIDYDTIRPFASYETVKQIGYNPDEIIEVQPSDIIGYKLGETISADIKNPLGKIVRIRENKQLYYINGNKFYSVTDEQIVRTNFPNLEIIAANASELNNLTRGEPIKFKDGILIGIAGNNKIYVMENGKKRHIASEDVFNGMGFNWSNILWTDQFTGLNHPTGQPIYFTREIQIAKSNDDDLESSSPSEPADNGKMIRTPAEKTVYTGPSFATDVNTYLVADYNTGEILAGKNIDDIRPMASFAKVMTAYELMKEGLGLNKSKTYEAADHKAVYHNFRIVEGEKILNKNLLYASLISSINTATKMLVDSVEENENEFIKRMNEQAKNWGLKNTVFTDVTGESLNNKTTARDYLTLYINAIKNVDVNRSLSVKLYEYDELLDLDGKPHHYDNNSNELMAQSGLEFEILNSKTGYLDEAGSGLAMAISANASGKKFVIITMGNADYDNRFNEPRRLAQWTITTF